MSTIKKWKIGVSTSSSQTVYVYIDAPTATEASKLAKIQNPNAHGFHSPIEVK